MTPQVEPNGSDDVRGALCLGHPLRRLDVEGEQFVDEDVLAGGDRGEGDVRVSRGRSADHDECHFGVGEESVGIGVRAGDREPAREPLPGADVDIGDGDARHLQGFASSPGDGAPPPPTTADDPDPERMVGHRSERHNSW